MKICIWKLLVDGKIFRRSLEFEDVDKLEAFYLKSPLDEKHGYFEQITGPQRLYMDIDIPITNKSSNEDSKLSNKDGKLLDRNKWRSSLLLQCKYIEEHISTVSSHKPRILVFDQSTHLKYSSHILVENFYAQDHIAALVFHNSCKLIEGVDENVYHSSQLLRMWKSYKASNTSARKEAAFRFFNNQQEEVNNIKLSDTLVSNWNVSSYIYNPPLLNPRKRNPNNCKSNMKTENLIINLDKLRSIITSFNPYPTMSDFTSKLTLGEPYPLGNDESSFGDIIPIFSDGKAPIIIAGDEYNPQRATIFNSKFGKKKLVMNLDPESQAAKHYNAICEFIKKEAKLGNLGSDARTRKIYKEAGNIALLNANERKGIFASVTSRTSYSDMDYNEIKVSETSDKVAINGIIGSRVTGIYVGPATVKLVLIADVIMTGAEVKNKKAMDLIKGFKKMSIKQEVK